MTFTALIIVCALLGILFLIASARRLRRRRVMGGMAHGAAALILFLLAALAVLIGSNLGNANGHTTTNLPIIHAGGRFRHGQHLAFDAKKNAPLSNLFVSILQGCGQEIDRFASSTGTMTGLDAMS